MSTPEQSQPSFTVALTGVAGSGKSTVASFFERLSVPIIDADVIAREISAPGTDLWTSISGHFGAQIGKPASRITRTDIREQIFNSPDSKSWLEALLHPLIIREIDRQRNTVQSPYCLMVVPLLAKHRECLSYDRCLAVIASDKIAISRLQKRDHISRDLADKMIHSNGSQQELLALADDLVINHQYVSHIGYQVQALHQTYLRLSQYRTQK